MNSHGGLRVTLNANQRRHYEVLFSGLERSLATLEAATRPSLGARPDDPAESADTFAIAVNDLPPDFADAATPILADIRRTLRELQSALSLAARPVSRRHICRALVTSEIIRIEDSYSRALRGYGEVDPSVPESLDPVLRDLRSRLGDISALLSAPRTNQ